MDSTVVVVALIVLLMIGVSAIVIGRASYRQRRRLTAVADATPETTARPSLGERLASTRSALGSRMRGLLSRSQLDDQFWADVEEALVAADVGVAAAAEVTGRVRGRQPAAAGDAYDALRTELIGAFTAADRHLPPLGSDPIAIVVVGVNGSGKTTTIAKLAHGYLSLGASAVLGAADTFRAGAAEQIRQWGHDLGVRVVDGAPNSDPAAVAHDAMAAARTAGADVVIIDTAGRLHSNANLMDELVKVVRIVDRESSGPVEVLLVLDGTGGQNSIAQAKTFTDKVGVSGIAITKLDGTARGGVAVAVERELGVPIKLIGVGERPDDLIPFVPADFVNALLEPRDE